MSLPYLDRAPALAATLCLAVCLAGCASKSALTHESGATVPGASTAEAMSAEAVPAADGSVKASPPTGIGRFLGMFAPYRIDIQQGNFVSREMLAQLKEGMQRKEAITPEQVRFVLGTPLLTDIFHADRWDYLFRLKKQSGEVIASRVTVFFKDNRLVRIEGGLLPTEAEYLAFIAGTPAAEPSK